MKQTTFSDLERNNKTCMYAHLIDSSIMTLFCILQALSGLQTWGYIIIFAVLGFGPVIAEFFFWNKSHETPAIQHLVAIGFAVFYSFAIFTATNGLVFLFVIPMILIISVYNDAKYSLIINTGTVIESLIITIMGRSYGRWPRCHCRHTPAGAACFPIHRSDLPPTPRRTDRYPHWGSRFCQWSSYTCPDHRSGPV